MSILKVFVSVSFCPYYQYIWGNWEDLQIRKKFHQVFCFGRNVPVEVTETGNTRKIFHKCHIFDIGSNMTDLVCFVNYFLNPNFFLSFFVSFMPLSLYYFSHELSFILFCPVTRGSKERWPPESTS